MKLKIYSNHVRLKSTGAAIVEVTLLIALIAVLVATAVQEMSKNMLEPFCLATNGLDEMIYWEMSRDTSQWQCMQDTDTGEEILY